MPHDHSDGAKVVPLHSRWSTDADYDPDLYVTNATDDNGHDTVLPRVAVPPEIATRIHQLVEDPLFPDYLTTGDVVRDALYHRLHHLALRHPDPAVRADLAAVLKELGFVQQLASASGVADRYTRVLTAFREAAEGFLHHGDGEGIRSLCERAREFGADAREPYASALLQAVQVIEKRAFKAGLI